MQIAPSRFVALAAVALSLVSLHAFGEKSAVNIHLDPMVGTGLDHAIFVSGAALKVDTTLIKALGPLAPQIEGFGVSALNRTYLDDGSMFGGGIGLRLRLFNDEKGYFFNPGQKYHGNFWGNLWVDAHFTYASGGFGPGFDVGAGYEFSLVEGMSIGPAAKFMLNTQHQLLMFGLSITIGAPDRVPDESDYDSDGVLGAVDLCPNQAGPAATKGCPITDKDNDGVGDATDKCPTEPEDKDGFEDEDGCPDPDNDFDKVLDQDDTCPLVAGPVANRGCPDEDADADGVVDRNDACPAEKGLSENKGCPVKDTDGDGVTDLLDKCVDVAGDTENEGCPLTDADADSVPDRFDNCPNEKGPASNSGCPAKQKQLVQITREKLVITEKVYFASGKSQVLAKSNALLNQVAAILKQHGEIKSLQIEGHTDSSGDAVKNTMLSQERADAVKTYLLSKGIEAGRVKAIGFGPDRPAGSNETPAGRENNRRVEFTITQG